MTHRHEFATAEAFPLSYRYHRRRSQSSAPSANRAGSGNLDKSRAVGDVLKRFANRTGGGNFAQFLDSAYQQQTDNKEHETTSQSSGDDEQHTGNEGPVLQTNEKARPSYLLELIESDVRQRTKTFDEESQRPQLHLVEDDVSDDGSPPSLAADDSKWTMNYATDDARDESDNFRNMMSQCSLRQSGRETIREEAEMPSSAVAARASRNRCQLNSADLTRGSPELASMNSVDYDHAIATLVSIFSSPWTAELLGVVLNNCKGSITDAIDKVLAHGDGDPGILIETLGRKALANRDPGVRALCKTERLGLEEENEADAENPLQASQEVKLELKGAAPETSIVSDDVESKSDVPSEILPTQERDMDEVSLLSCSIAEGSYVGSDQREQLGRGLPQLHRSALFRTRHEQSIPRDDSFVRLLVSDEWATKFRFDEVMPVQEEKGHEC